MAIQMRRGKFGKFTPSKLLPGEWAVVQQDDTSVRDGKSVYVAFSAGDVKRMATHEDMIDDCTEIIESKTDDIVHELTDRVSEVNSDISTAEAERVRAEAARQSSEAERARSEGQRTAREAERDGAEGRRAAAESLREQAERGRKDAEAARVRAESARVSAESSRASAEGKRATAEAGRISTLAEIKKTVDSVVSSEAARATAESSRASAETKRSGDESSRRQAETARASEESKRAAADAERELRQKKNDADQAANNARMNSLQPRILTEGEFDADRVPSISDPSDVRLYLVPLVGGSGADGNSYVEWRWLGDKWEQIGVSNMEVPRITTNEIDAVLSGGSRQGESVLSLTGLSYFCAKFSDTFKLAMEHLRPKPITEDEFNSVFAGMPIEGDPYLGKEGISMLIDAVGSSFTRVQSETINRINLKSDVGHTHDASEITGELDSSNLPVVPVSKGGTGETSLTDLLMKLDLSPESVGIMQPADNINFFFENLRASVFDINNSAASYSGIQSQLDGKADSYHTHSATDITTGVLSSSLLPTISVTKGGTGSSTAAGARTSIGAASKDDLDALKTSLTAAPQVYQNGVLNAEARNGVCRVTVRGIVNGSGSWGITTLATLPVGMRPLSAAYCVILTQDTVQQTKILEIDTTGEARVISKGASDIWGVWMFATITYLV